jgi:hypothetical protein
LVIARPQLRDPESAVKVSKPTVIARVSPKS